MPSAQGSHTELTAAADVPFEHFSHAVWPMPRAKLPGSHGEQTVSFVGVQSDATNVPGVHCEQGSTVARPVPFWKNPDRARTAVHALKPSAAEYRPTLHDVQLETELAPSASPYLPACVERARTVCVAQA